MQTKPLIVSKIHARINKEYRILTAIFIGLLFSLPVQAASVGETYSANRDQPQLITRPQALAYFLQKLEEDRDFQSDPMRKEIMICLMNSVVDEIYGEKTSLAMTTFEKRTGDLFEGSKFENPRTQLLAQRCIWNSKEVEKAIAKNALEKRAQSSSTSLLDIDELRVDIDYMKGKNVRVGGIGHYVMDSFMLTKDRNDTNPILVDITKLSREQRREILKQCVDIMEGCRLTIYGTVGDVKYKKGIIAERIEWQ